MGGGEKGRHEGTEDLFLIAFSQEIEVGLKLPDSQADSQPPPPPWFRRISIAIGHDSAGPARASSTIDTAATFVYYPLSRIVYFRAAYPAREPISLFPSPLRILSSPFFLFPRPSIATPRFNPPQKKERDREVSGKRKTNVLFRDDPTTPSPSLVVGI